MVKRVQPVLQEQMGYQVLQELTVYRALLVLPESLALLVLPESLVLQVHLVPRVVLEQSWHHNLRFHLRINFLVPLAAQLIQMLLEILKQASHMLSEF
jgi:hypothetical protein